MATKAMKGDRATSDHPHIEPPNHGNIIDGIRTFVLSIDHLHPLHFFFGTNVVFPPSLPPSPPPHHQTDLVNTFQKIGRARLNLFKGKSKHTENRSLDWLIDAVPSVNLARKSTDNKKEGKKTLQTAWNIPKPTTPKTLLHRIKPK